MNVEFSQCIIYHVVERLYHYWPLYVIQPLYQIDEPVTHNLTLSHDANSQGFMITAPIQNKFPFLGQNE